MKIFKVLVLIFCLTVLALAGTGLYVWQNRLPLIQKAANDGTAELFEGSIRLKSAEMQNWHMVIEGITGDLKMDTRKVPIQIGKLRMESSAWESLLTRRSELVFEDFRPATPKSSPLSGKVRLRFGDNPSAALQTQLKNVRIEDYAWIEPNSFEGLSGSVSGTIRLRMDSQENARFDINLTSDEKGGEVPARFLEFALPYLPKAQNTKELQRQIQNQQSVRFIKGSINAKTTDPGKIQSEIKMLFPDLNININLNLTILVDEEHAFLRAFKLLSLFKITQAGTK